MFKTNSSCPARNLVLPENSAQDHTFVNLILRLSQILMAHYSKYPKSDHSSATPAHSSLVPGALPSLLDFCPFSPGFLCSLLCPSSIYSQSSSQRSLIKMKNHLE